MKIPLRIAPGKALGVINVVDADHRVVCAMHEQDISVAKRIVRHENGWWLTLFGERPDEHQRRYNQWIAAK